MGAKAMTAPNTPTPELEPDSVMIETRNTAEKGVDISSQVVLHILDQCAAAISSLTAERDALREFAESFYITVVQDSFYKDVTLHLDKPHSLSIRIRNDSSKS